MLSKNIWRMSDWVRVCVVTVQATNIVCVCDKMSSNSSAGFMHVGIHGCMPLNCMPVCKTCVLGYCVHVIMNVEGVLIVWIVQCGILSADLKESSLSSLLPDRKSVV